MGIDTCNPYEVWNILKVDTHENEKTTCEYYRDGVTENKHIQGKLKLGSAPVG